MVAVRTGFPSPMQPMTPMGGPGTFPAAPLPAGQTPVPAPVPPMPLAGFPPPPVKSPMAQQVSNAPRRRRFGDSLEGMLGRNIFATQQQRPMPTPMMPRPMEMGGAVQYFANGGNANQQAAASMLAAGIGNVGGKAITSGAQSVQDRFSDAADRRKRRRRKRRERLAREEAARLAAEQAALAEAAALQNNPNIDGPMESAIGYFGSSAASSPTAQQNNPNIPSSPPPNMISATPPGFGSTPPPPPSPGMSEGLEILNQMQDAANLQAALGVGIDATPPGFGAGPGTQFTYDQGAIGLGDNRDDTQANLDSQVDLNYTPSDAERFGYGFPYTKMFPNEFATGVEGSLGSPVKDDTFVESLFPTSRTPPIFPPSDRGFEPEGTQIAPEAATATGFSYFPSDTRDVMPPVIGEKDDSFAESMFVDEITNPYAVGGGFDVTAPEDTDSLDPRGDQIVSPTGTGIGIPPENTGGSDKDDKSRPRLTSEELESLKASLGEQVPISGIEKVINQVIGKAFFGLGSGFADKLKASSEAERQAIVDQHLNALNSGATPVYNDKGEYIGFNMNTMDTFADKVLAADDISIFLPGGSADADGDGVIDYDRFQQVFNAQSTAADADPFGQSTEQGFITSDGREFFVDATGNVVEVEDGVVPFEVGGGDDVTDIFTETITTGGGDDGGDSGSDTGVDTGHTVNENGEIVCNTEGYIYNPETKVCEPPKEEEDKDPTINVVRGEDFDDVLKRVVVAAPNVAPISANVRPMQEGGMAGLNRAADNFLKALAG